VFRDKFIVNMRMLQSNGMVRPFRPAVLGRGREPFLKSNYTLFAYLMEECVLLLCLVGPTITPNIELNYSTLNSHILFV
jgi:hypothetical protein